jgi:hypothetical protein
MAKTTKNRQKSAEIGRNRQKMRIFAHFCAFLRIFGPDSMEV